MYDVVVVGGGIVGVATAMTWLERLPGSRLLLLEKETGLARHQTGRNSGVIHAGVYYAPGSLKARLCKAGREATLAFCREHGVAHRVTGKLLVATDAAELERAAALRRRCAENGIDHQWLDANALALREPWVAGRGAIHVPATGIVDYVGMTRAMSDVVRSRGGEIRLGECVLDLRETGEYITVATDGATHRARRLVVCAGLQSDRLARKLGLARDVRIVPFRGEYFRLAPPWHDRFTHLVYPIPDPALPFLGVHVTRMIDGSVTVGPNAVLGFARERYARFGFDWRDAAGTLAYPGFWRAMAPHLRSGAAEFSNSIARRRYLQLCRKYVPALAIEDLEPHPTGIRAQAIHADGRMEHDFLVLHTRRSIHVCNAPSPAATSALPIAGYVVDEALRRLEQ